MRLPHSAATDVGVLMRFPHSAATSVGVLMRFPHSAATSVGVLIRHPNSAATNVGVLIRYPNSAATDIGVLIRYPNSAATGVGVSYGTRILLRQASEYHTAPEFRCDRRRSADTGGLFFAQCFRGLHVAELTSRDVDAHAHHDN